jgi:hypothetical protein
VQTYYGHDATDVGIYSMMGGKQEHSRGTLVYNLTQRLLKSRLPIIIESQPRLPGNKLSPVMSMFACVKRLKGGSTRLHHIIADSAFAAAKSIKELTVLYNTYVTISINNSPTSGLAAVHNFINQDLPHGHARLYQSSSALIEVVQRGDYTSAIATNAFKVLETPPSTHSSSHSVEPSDIAGPSTPVVAGIPVSPLRLSYASALSLWQNEDVVTLKQLFRLPATFSSHDIVDIILAGTGIQFF